MQEIQAISEKSKQMETVTCPLIELEDCVCNLQDRCASPHSPPPKKSVKVKLESLDEEVNKSEKNFSKLATKMSYLVAQIDMCQRPSNTLAVISLSKNLFSFSQQRFHYC